MNNFKILFFNSSKEWGGNETWTVRACNALRERGHKVALSVRTDIFDGKLHPDIEIIKLAYRHEADMATYFSLAKFARKFKPDVFFPTKRKEYFIAGLLGRLLGVKVVIRLGIMRNISKSDLPQRFVYSGMPDKIVVNAQKIKDDLIEQRLVSDDKVHVIYNGYNFKEEVQKVELPAGLEGKFIFSSAGRLAPQKGYDILLKAARMVRGKSDNFAVVIAGEGSFRKEYENFINSNELQNHIILLGQIENVRGLFAASDAVLIPSRNEGIPNTLMEAWSVKKPVIAADAAGIPEAIESGRNGLLIELTEENLAKQMRILINTPELCTEYGNKGFQTLITKFTTDKMVRELEAIFDELVNTKK